MFFVVNRKPFWEAGILPLNYSRSGPYLQHNKKPSTSPLLRFKDTRRPAAERIKKESP